MAYLDIDIDKAVAYLGGGYRIIWDDKNDPYWINPIPADISNQKLHVLNWASPVQSTYVERYKPEDLDGVVRSGDYLDKAWSQLEEYVGEATISTFPLDGVDNFIVCIGGLWTNDPDLDVAKWEAAGIWAIENIVDCLDPTYLKVKDDGVFLTDEKTFFIIQ